jgi:hypothetical protein
MFPAFKEDLVPRVRHGGSEPQSTFNSFFFFTYNQTGIKFYRFVFAEFGNRVNKE